MIFVFYCFVCEMKTGGCVNGCVIYEGRRDNDGIDLDLEIFFRKIEQCCDCLHRVEYLLNIWILINLRSLRDSRGIL